MRGKEQPFSIDGAREKNLIGWLLGDARRAAGLSRERLCAALSAYGLDISPYGISKWEQGARTPNAYQLMALCRALSVRNPLELYAEELDAAGLRKLAEYRDDLIASGRYAPKRPRAAEIEYVELKLYDIAASAGTGSFLDSGDYELLRVPRDTVPAGTDCAIRVSGSSMEPVYRDGQIVWVRQTETIRPGEVGIFVQDGESFIKLYEERMPEASEIEDFTDSYGAVRMQPVLVSYNKKYAPRAVPAASYLKVVGRVLS